MSKLKHYKGDGWEVKVKYDEECRILLWQDCINFITKIKNDFGVNLIIEEINKKVAGNYYIGKNTYDRFINHLDNLTAPEELTYDTVVKELEGLEGEALYEAMKNYEYQFNEEAGHGIWSNLIHLFQFFDIPQAFKRGLIKLRRAK